MSAIKNLGNKANSGGFKPGPDSRRNAGGKPSIANDLERARLIGVPAEILAVLDEWHEEGGERLAELGPDGFLAGLRQAMDDATKRVLPLDPAEARAMWWRTILPVVYAGPSGSKDSVWTYASQEVGVRLLGKPKETIAVEGGTTPIDWTRVPPEKRDTIGAVLLELQGYLSQPESDTEH